MPSKTKHTPLSLKHFVECVTINACQKSHSFAKFTAKPSPMCATYRAAQTLAAQFAIVLNAAKSKLTIIGKRSAYKSLMVMAESVFAAANQRLNFSQLTISTGTANQIETTVCADGDSISILSKTSFQKIVTNFFAITAIAQKAISEVARILGSTALAAAKEGA